MKTLFASAAVLALTIGAAGTAVAGGQNSQNQATQQTQAQNQQQGQGQGQGTTKATICHLSSDKGIDLSAQENANLRTQFEANFQLAQGQTTLTDFAIPEGGTAAGGTAAGGSTNKAGATTSGSTSSTGNAGAGGDPMALAQAARELCEAAKGHILTVGEPGAEQGHNAMTLTARASTTQGGQQNQAAPANQGGSQQNQQNTSTNKQGG